MVLIRDRKAALIVFVGITWIESTFFLARYGLWSSWRTTAGGRALFLHILSFWVLITWIGVTIVGGPDFPPFRDDVREFLYMAFAVCFFNMNLTLLRVQSHYPDEVKFRNPLKK